jgi:hypothetical protein
MVVSDGFKKSAVCFGVAGDGKLIDKLGTVMGFRYVQLYNGVATISVKINNGKTVVSAAVEAMQTVFINFKK